MKKLVVVLLLAGSCAPAARPPSDDGHEDMQRALHDLEVRRAELRAVASAQDCRRTCELAELVCEAASRICAIAARSPDRPDFPARCEEARSSCAEARAACVECEQRAGGP